jgi:hypothetical protein
MNTCGSSTEATELTVPPSQRARLKLLEHRQAVWNFSILAGGHTLSRLHAPVCLADLRACGSGTVVSCVVKASKGGITRSATATIVCTG